MSYQDYLDGVRDGFNIGFKAGYKKGYQNAYLNLPYRCQKSLDDFQLETPKYKFKPLPKLKRQYLLDFDEDDLI